MGLLDFMFSGLFRWRKLRGGDWYLLHEIGDVHTTRWSRTVPTYGYGRLGVEEHRGGIVYWVKGN
jgi:hypothetical protein